MNPKTLSSEMRQELVRILYYWIDHAQDQENGGFFGEIDENDRINPDAPKSAILNARILWTFSSAYRLCAKPEYLEMATRAYEYVIKHFIDRERGGVYWSLHPDGTVADDRKQLYAIAFTIYGLSEYFGATGNESALDEAKSLFRSIEEHGFDAEFGGYIEAFSGDWGELQDFRLSEKDENAPKTMNTHLHILEAYANLLRYWKDDVLMAQLRQLLRTSLDKIVRGGNFGLFFDMQWNPTNLNVSYGHDIEGSWLLWESAEIIGDKQLMAEVRDVALKMADATLAEGIDPEAGVREEFHVGEGVLDPTYHWWPQAEGVVGFYNAYQLNKNEAYLNTAYRLWEFTKSSIIDRKKGEWHWHVSKDGSPVLDAPKVGFWKCPYHNGRACMEIIRRVEGGS